jgi:hypothetical protein
MNAMKATDLLWKCAGGVKRPYEGKALVMKFRMCMCLGIG